MEEKKITFTDGNETLEFYVVEETRIGGRNYLLVTDSDDTGEEENCYVLKDLSRAEDAEAVYEFVEDDDELEAVARVFDELLEDVKIQK